jgi:DNA-binding response OmpR family regulator
MRNVEKHYLWRDRRILALDDSPEITSLIREIFSSCGARVDCVDDGAKAMAMLQMADYDLIVLDLVMPRPDGWDVLGFLRQMHPGALERTLLLTGGRHERNTVRLEQGKIVPVLYKPFRLEQLCSEAEKVISRPFQAA